MLSVKQLQEEDDASGSESGLSCSPSAKSVFTEDSSSLFKTVLEDYVLDTDTRVSKYEFERYKARQQKKDKEKDSEEHESSHRCENCQQVAAFCKCYMYGGSARKFGHRVHWADEVWNKPLKTILGDENVDINPENTGSDKFHNSCTNACREGEPKPILKHKQTCIVIVSD